MDRPDNPPTPAPRGRWKRRGLIGLLGLVLVVLLAPLYVGPVLRGILVGRLEERLDARVRVQAVSFAWPATLRVRSLTLSDENDAPLGSVDDLRLRLELVPLLAGKLRAEVELEYPEMVLSRAPSGAWNWERRLIETLEEEPGDGGGEDDSLPDVEASVSVLGGRVVLRAEDGETTLEDIGVDVRVVGLENPASFALSVAVRGPGGPAGKARLEGSFTAAPRGRIDWREFGGWASLALESIDLAGFTPALSTLVPLGALGGIAVGRVELELVEGLALTGEGKVTIDDLRVRGPLADDEATHLGRVELSGNATQAEGGAGSQRLKLEVGEFLSVLAEGRSNTPRTGNGDASGTLTLSADLGPLTAAAGQWFPLQEGVQVRGTLQQSLDFALQLKDLNPTAADLRTRAGVMGLAGNDGAGRALDLSELERVGLELEASASFADGTLSIPRLALDAGPLRCDARLEAARSKRAGNAGEYALKEATFEALADLERLRGTLSQIFELEATDFGGSLEARGAVEVRDGVEVATGSLDANTLSLDGASLDGLHAQLEARLAAGGELEGSATIRLASLRLPRMERAPGRNEPLASEAPSEPGFVQLARLAATLSFREDAHGKGEHDLVASANDGAVRLELDAVSQRGPGAELALTATARSECDLALLAGALAQLRPGVSGRASLVTELQGDWGSDGLGSARAKGELAVTQLGARDAEGEPLRLQALSPAKLSFDGALDRRRDEALLRSFELETPGSSLRGSAVLAGLAGGAETARIEEGSLSLTCDLQALGAELALGLDTGGWSFGGGALEASLQIRSEARKLALNGRMTTERLLLLPPGRGPLELTELSSVLELSHDLEQDSTEVLRADLSASTGKVSMSGTLQGLRAPETARGALEVTVEGELERLLADLGLEDPAQGRRSSGELEAKLSLGGDRGNFQWNGSGKIEHFRLELAAQEKGREPFVLEEPAIEFAWEAAVSLAQLDLDITRLTLDSGIARGGARGRIENLAGLGREDVRFAGLTGDLVYVPDRLGAVLAPFLPGRLSGSREERLTFVLDGRARDFDVASLLSRSQGRVELGIGLFERPEITLGGALALEAKEGQLLLRGDLGANGGALQVDGTLALAGGDGEPLRSKLAITARDVRATPGLAPLLGILHPAFAQAKLTKGSLEGMIALDLDLSYDGALTLEQLKAGWAALPKEPISGSGRLELRQARLRDSPLLGMMKEFGIDSAKSLDVRPIEFTVRAGRVTYAKPWTWTLSGTETTFTGSVGLDESLDLSWNLPIGETLVSRWSFLASLEGQTLSIPLRGSVRAPRLEARDLLKDLAAKAAKAQLDGRLGLGGAEGNNPAALLTRADELWNKGQKKEAAEIYGQLREEFKLSLTYVLNKDRIKERAKYEAPK